MIHREFVKKHLKKHRKNVICFIFLSTFISGLSVVIPIVTGNYIDYLLQYPNMESITKFVLLFIIMAITQITCSFRVNIYSTKIKSNISYEIMSDVILYIQKCSIKNIDDFDSTYLVESILNDSKMIVDSISYLLSGVISNLFIFFFCFYVVLSTIPLIAILQLIMMFLYFFVFRFMRPKIILINVRLKEKYANLVANLQDQIENIKFIKVFNIFEFYKNKTDTSYNELYLTEIKYSMINFMLGGGSNIISLGLQLILFFYGGYSIINKNMTIGMFTILISYLNMTNKAMEYFISLNTKILDLNIAIDRILYYFSFIQENSGSLYLESIDCIQIKNLCFKYKNNSIINNLNTEFKKGKIYQVIGENGCGKTTLLMLLSGLYLNEYTGKILFNSTEIGDLDFKFLRENKMSIMLQNDYIISESLANNIVFGKEFFLQRNQSNFIHLLTKFRITDLYSREEMLNINKLSGGEIKKIELVRLLLKKDCDVMILDEPTTYLDVFSKQILFDYLNEYKKNKIIILVSHENIFDDLIDEKIEL